MSTYDLLGDAIAGRLSSESQTLVCKVLTDYVKTGELHLPTPASYLKRLRDEHIVATYELMGSPPHAEFYRQFQQASTKPPEDDVVGLMLHNIHVMSNRFNIPIPSVSTVKRVVK